MATQHLEKNDMQYKVFLYIFYVCGFIMLSITAYGVYAMLNEWDRNGIYVMGEVLVITHVPFDNFAKLTTWLFFSSIIGWYCCSRVGWRRTAGNKIKNGRMALLQIMLLGFVI